MLETNKSYVIEKECLVVWGKGGDMFCEKVKLGVVMWSNRSLHVIQFHFVLWTRSVRFFWQSVLLC